MLRRAAGTAVLAMVLSIGAAVAAGGDDDAAADPKDLPREAVAAQKEYLKVVKKADEEREAKVSAARATMVKRLKPLMTAETKRGNLEGGLAVQQAIDDAQSGKAPAETTARAAFDGAWALHWTTGGVTRCKVAGDRVELDGVASPKVVRKGDGLTVSVATSAGGKHVHRYRATGPYLVCEAWHDPNAFGRGDAPTDVGIGRRAQ